MIYKLFFIVSNINMVAYYNMIEYINACIPQDNDEYNESGINISAQKRRQELVDWTKVVYHK